jgi:tyrosine-protein phosphatase YwqE
MGFLTNIFKTKKKEVLLPPFDFSLIGVDMHSHLLPNIDDGSQSMDYTIGMILKFKELGFHKIITTPHVMQDCYPNTPESIRLKLNEVKEELNTLAISMEFEASAEYNVEDSLFEKLESGTILPFATNHLLFEYSFFSKPYHTEKLVFDLIVKGYKPIIAHFERYPYYHNQPDTIAAYKEKGVEIQLNLLSIIGHYGPDVQQQAFYMIDNHLVDYVATDCHRIEHLELLSRFASHPYFHKLGELDLKNKYL